MNDIKLSLSHYEDEIKMLKKDIRKHNFLILKMIFFLRQAN
jgi:hypothetical protein